MLSRAYTGGVSLINNKNDYDPIVGIEINDHYIRVLHIEGNNDSQYKIIDYQSFVLPAGVVIDNTIYKDEYTLTVIKDLFSCLQKKVTSVAIGINSSKAIICTLQVDRLLNNNEVASEIELRAHHYIPYPLEDVMLDYQILGVSKNNKKLMDVLLVAIVKEEIMQIISIIQQAGITVKLIDLADFAIQRADLFFRNAKVIENLPLLGDISDISYCCGLALRNVDQAHRMI